ncbi:MAG: hypothetical protein LBO04_02270, partial [Spirochaetaceae bacterium]|nr:hypothetical protein [Spirochaetaceae bacterium]
KNFYAKYYEKEFVVESFFETDVEIGKNHEPLNIDTKEKQYTLRRLRLFPKKLSKVRLFLIFYLLLKN